jgi:hypothetical protein
VADEADPQDQEDLAGRRRAMLIIQTSLFITSFHNNCCFYLLFFQNLIPFFNSGKRLRVSFGLLYKPSDISVQCYKTFLSVNYGFLQKARVFVIGKLFQASLTNPIA